MHASKPGSNVLVLASFACIASCSTIVSAATITLNPTRSLTILSKSSSSHDSSILSVYSDGEGQGFGTDQERALMQFDLSGIAPDATINSATLTMVHDSAIYPTGQPAGNSTEVLALSKTWTSTASWDFAGPSDPWDTPGGDTAGSFAINKTVVPENSGIVPLTFDVTNLVSQWTTGALSNDGMVLSGSFGDGLFFRATGDNAPSLVINFTPVPEPGCFALFLGGGALLLRRRRARHSASL